MDRVVRYDLKSTLELYSQMRKICRKIEAARDQVAAEFQFTGTQIYVLWAVWNRPNATFSELAEATGLAVNTVSTVIKELNSRHMLHIAQNELDGRSSLLSLSDVGREVMSHILDACSDCLMGDFERVFANLMRTPGAVERMENLDES